MTSTEKNDDSDDRNNDYNNTTAAIMGKATTSIKTFYQGSIL